MSEIDEGSGLLPTDPPGRAVRYAAALLLALAFAALLFATLVPLPETASATFVLEPIDVAASVQAPIAGRVERVLVRDGDLAQAGQALFEVRSDELRDADTQLRSQLEDQHRMQNERAQLEQAHAQALAALDSEQELARQELALRRASDVDVQALLARKEKAVADGLLAGITVLEDRVRAADSAQLRVQTEQRLQRLAAERNERISAHEQRSATDLAELKKLVTGIAALRAQIGPAIDDLRIIRATHASIVLGVRVAPGHELARGDELARLAPIDVALQARMQLDERDLERLEPGLPTRLFLSAFPFERNGTVPARIRWVSPASDGDAFQALAAIGKTPSNIVLRPGMRGDARVLLARRTLFRRFIDEARGVRERMWLAPAE